MDILRNLVRKNIWNLKPYSCARDEFKGEARAFLDANESAYNAPYNRYPDPLNLALKEKIISVAGYHNIEASNLFFGVGSDECIDILYRVLCNPGIDNAVAISPSYGMYGVCADVNDIEYRTVPLTPDTFAIDTDAVIAACDEHTKIIWICSPNNPTGNSFDFSDIRRIYDTVNAIVVVDEAYIHFSVRESLVEKVSEMERLVVLQTMSKAWGCAAVRLGIAFACRTLIDIFNKVKYPYNINLLTSEYVNNRLDEFAQIKAQVNLTLQLRQKMADSLSVLNFVDIVYPSDANFLLVKVTNANAIYSYLCDRGIVVRNRNNVVLCGNCLRITIGSYEENAILIAALNDYTDK
ncbi:MAG: histidinol-phosphate transaminase [Muribaculaceae bacterium]|nr:histidinol-phosphate transaminase [Muribaculaceae bacterium]